MGLLLPDFRYRSALMIDTDRRIRFDFYES